MTPEELDEIRARWTTHAHALTCSRDESCRCESGIRDPDIAALLAEAARLRSNTRPYLIIDEPEGIIGMVDATNEAEAWAAFQAENPGDYDGDPDDHDVVVECVSVKWCGQVVDDLCKARDEAACMKVEVARLQALVPPPPEPMGWQHLRGSDGWEYVDAGRFRLLVMGSGERSGWRVFFGDNCVVDHGHPGGDAGKAAAEAAYRRACGGAE